MNLKKIKLLIVILTFFISFSNIHGQNYHLKGYILDSKTEKPLSYASIVVLNKQVGVSADENGWFLLEIEKVSLKDTLVISHIGYKTRHICIETYRRDRIYLEKQVFTLMEVRVSPDKKKRREKTITLNKFKKNKCFIRYTKADTSKNYWIPSRPKEPTIEAIFFPFKEEYFIYCNIKEVYLHTFTIQPPAIFSLRIMNANDNNNTPTDLIDTTIIITVTEGREFIKVDLQGLGINFPKSGLFIGMELLVIPENKYEIEIDGKIETGYSPFLSFTQTDKEGRFWIYTEGNWKVNNNLIDFYLNNGKIGYYKPAISLVLSNKPLINKTVLNSNDNHRPK